MNTSFARALICSFTIAGAVFLSEAAQSQAIFRTEVHPVQTVTLSTADFLLGKKDGKPVMVYGDGGQTRDLINVRDVVRANWIASEHPRAAGKIFNICTGVETRILDLLEVMYELIPNAPPPQFAASRAGDIYRSVGSPQKARDMLGFHAEVSLVDGLKENSESNWISP